MFMRVLCACMAVHHMYTWCPWRPEEDLGISHDCEMPCECWHWTLVLLTTEPLAYSFLFSTVLACLEGMWIEALYRLHTSCDKSILLPFFGVCVYTYVLVHVCAGTKLHVGKCGHMHMCLWRSKNLKCRFSETIYLFYEMESLLGA